MEAKMGKRKEIHGQSNTRNIQQRNYLKQHLYMQKKHKQQENFIRTIFLNHKTIHDKESLGNKEKEQISRIFLQTREKET